MEDTINSIAMTLFSIYLPIADTGSRIAISLAISKIFSKIVCSIINFILSFKIVDYMFSNNISILIEPSNVMYPKILKYIYDKYQHMICGYKLQNDYGANKLNANKFKKTSIKEEYVHNNIKYSIYLTLDEKVNDIQNNTNKSKKNPINNLDIIISSNTTIKIMELYLNNIILNANVHVSNKIPIYRINSINGKNDNSELSWKCSITKLSKNTKNTIVSDDVQQHFYNDIDNFINGEKYYETRGLPYKRGYILHGEPGCGKTSLIKAIANQYQLPIFIVDLNSIKTNSDFVKITNDISTHVVNDQKYLVVFEDIDRTELFENYRYRNSVTKDCFLNVLDGLDEYSGRITILTANDFSVLSRIKALVRPGRIDNIIEIKYCTLKQIDLILKFYFDDENLEVKVNPNIIINPSQLIQLIFKIKNIDSVVKILNKYKDFTKLNLEKIHELYSINTCEQKVEDVVVNNEEAKVDKDEDDIDINNLSRKDQNRLRLQKRAEKNLNENIKFLSKQIRIYDLKIGQAQKENMSQKEKIHYGKLVLHKESCEIKLAEANNRLELNKKRMIYS